MNYLFIDRGAQHARIIVITFKSRLGAQMFDLALRRALQVHAGGTGLPYFANVIQNLADNMSAALHLLDLSRRFTDDGHTQQLTASARLFWIRRMISSVTRSTGISPLTASNRPLRS